MLLAWIAIILSMLTLLGALLLWLALIIRRRLGMGSIEPLRRFRWSSDIFGQGLAIICKRSLILILPLVAQAVAFTQALVSEHASLTGFLEAVLEFPARLLDMFVPLLLFVFLSLASFLSSLFQLYGAMIAPFGSTLVAGICFLGAAAFSLSPRASGGALSLPGLADKKRRFLRFFSGLAGFILLSSLIIAAFKFKEKHSYWWLSFLLSLLTLPVSAFAASTLLVLMKAADRNEELSLTKAISRAAESFRPLLYFGLITVLISSIGALPVYIGSSFFTRSSEFGASRSWIIWPELVNTCGTGILTAMICFIPAIVIVRRVSLRSAANHCIDLWARYPLAAAKFVVFGSLFMTVAVIFQNLLQLPPSQSENGFIAFPHLFAFPTIAVGVLVMSSMIVFYKKLQDPQGEISQAQIGTD